MQQWSNGWKRCFLYGPDQGYVTRRSLETGVRRLGGWCEMASRLQEHELGSRGMAAGEDTAD
jgi:hypothetical protein